MKSFEKTVKQYPKRFASIPLIHLPPIETASNELEDLRKRLSELVNTMDKGQAKKFAKCEGKNDELKIEYLTRKGNLE